MNHDSYPDDSIRAILSSVKTVAIVGASANNVRPSYFVATYLKSKGYDVLPVNPGQAGKEIAGLKILSSLRDIGRPVDMVDIFRNSQAAMDAVIETLALDPLPRVIWMQLRVRNDDAARLAEAKGVKVVMNRCPKIEYARLAGEIGWAGVSSGFVTAKKPSLAAGIQRFGIAPAAKP